MNYRYLLTAVIVGLIFVACKTNSATSDSDTLKLYDLEKQDVVSGDAVLDRLRAARIVLVGEHHNNQDHHQAQLNVIRTLHKAGRKVAVGMEMFRRDSQDALDQWILDKMPESQFESVYLDNWNFRWDLYSPIFRYAKANSIPMVGLNVARGITSQVAYKGFASLTDVQRGALEGITCNVTSEYRAFIKDAYGAHGHGNMNFNRFCEAQLVWDTAMAVYAIAYLEKNTDTVLVLLAGSGHARKLGIPTQLEKRTSWPYAVLLPETKGVFDKASISKNDADYIIFNE